MIDLHCHPLAGIDDGPPTMDAALALVAAAHAAGTGTLVATPHVSLEYPNRADTIAHGVGELNERIRAAGVAIAVLTGAEISMTVLSDIATEELSRLTLAGGRWLLIEPPWVSVLSGVDEIVAALQRRGFGVVLAHPERCRAFQRDRAMLERLVRAGVLVSITAGSLDGRFGRTVRRFSNDLLRDGLVHNVASDAHDVAGRPPSIAAELERAGLGSLRDWLTQAVPDAIVHDRAIPPRPDVQIPVETGSRWSLRPRRGG
jgi:protein-tyrosine phosphatase